MKEDQKKCPITPHGGRVVLSPIDEGEQKSGNIIIPDAGKERPEMGYVVATSSGYWNKAGSFVTCPFVVGDKAMVPKFGVQTVEINREKYIIAHINDVLGTIKEDANE